MLVGEGVTTTFVVEAGVAALLDGVPAPRLAILSAFIFCRFNARFDSTGVAGTTVNGAVVVVGVACLVVTVLLVNRPWAWNLS